MADSTQWQWALLPNSPVATSRTDDIWFFDEQTGWLVNSSGYVCKTEDGGNGWIPKFFLYPNLPSMPYLRCMGWANRQIGWFGSVTNISVDAIKKPSQYLSTLLHHTTDGGETWSAVENLPEGSPAGICGFYAVNEQVAYGSGTNDPGLPGPAIIKTTNNGGSWELIPMEQHADNLIDIYFFDENNGFVVGGKIDPSCPTENPAYPPSRLSRYVQLKPVVLRTNDGGKNWINSAAGTAGYPCGEWGWKIQFINEDIGFVALENFRDAAILTTTNGGASWVRKHVALSQEPDAPPINNDLEGIGFINAKQGWVGGWGNNFAGLMNSYTADGGETWTPQNHDPICNSNSDPRYRINRYRFLGNPVTGGYCSGQQVFKLQKGAGKKTALAKKTTFGTTTVVAHHSGPAHSDEPPARSASVQHMASLALLEHRFELSAAASKEGIVEISYTLPENAENVFIGLWNQFAFHVRTLVSETFQTKGRRTVVWDGKDDQGNPLGEGIYICRMSTDGKKGSSQMVQLLGAT